MADLLFVADVQPDPTGRVTWNAQARVTRNRYALAVAHNEASLRDQLDRYCAPVGWTWDLSYSPDAFLAHLNGR